MNTATRPGLPWLVDAMHSTAVRLADIYVVSTIAAEAARTGHTVRMRVHGAVTRVPWLDVRPMLDHREVAPVTADHCAELLGWAAARGLMQQHPQHPHIVLLMRHAQELLSPAPLAAVQLDPLTAS